MDAIHRAPANPGAAGALDPGVDRMSSGDGAEARVGSLLTCPGCNIDGACLAFGELGPTVCLICDPVRARESWSLNDGVSCDDGMFCSVGDVCSAGSCSGEPRKCDDGIACNGVSTCDEAAGDCTPLNNLCDPSELCGSDGSCVTSCSGCAIAGNCVAAGAERAGDPCFICDPARSAADYVPAEGKACGAGASACSQQDSCDDAGVCQAHDLPSGTPCGDGSSSTCDASDVCDGSGTCSTRVAGNGTPCSDGDACTLTDTCRAGVCVAGPARVCSAGAVCAPDSGDCGCQEGQRRCNGSVLELCSGGSFDVLEACAPGTQICNATAARCDCVDDSDPATTLVQHPNFGCGFARSIGTQRWVSFDSGVEFDPLNGFAWARQGFLTRDDTADACAELDTGGLVGWQLPSINDVRSLAGGCAATDACPVEDAGCLSSSCADSCDSCLGDQGPNNRLYCRPIVPICVDMHTRSRCTDCPDPNFEWTLGPVNGNFLPYDPENRINGYCFHSGISL